MYVIINLAKFNLLIGLGSSESTETKSICLNIDHNKMAKMQMLNKIFKNQANHLNRIKILKYSES